MCAGDVTVEGPDGGMMGLHRWGIGYAYKRWEDIGGWVRENAALRDE